MYHRKMTEIPTEQVKSGTSTYKQVLIGSDVGPDFAMRRFVIEAGGGMPLHTNTVDHEQFVLGGRARVVVGGETIEVSRHDVLFIPAGVPHSYTTLGNGKFEFLCMVVNRSDITKIVGS